MIFEYKGFSADVEYNIDSGIYWMVRNTDDYVNFEAENAETVEEEFHKAVDDYLKVREEIKKNTAFNKINNPRIYKLPNSEKCFVIPTENKLVKFVYVGEPKIVEKPDGLSRLKRKWH